MTFNLATILTESALSHPDRPVAFHDGATLTYGELDAASSGVAGGLLAGGLSRGDRVAVQMVNGFEFLFAYFGILKAGLVMVPINPLLKAGELEHILTDCGAGLTLRGADLPEGPPVKEIAATAAEDTALIIYTSGTTGKPKGAELSHFQLFLNCTIAADTFGVEPGDVCLAALPFFHIYGLSGVINCAIRYGSTLAVVGRFEPQAVLDVVAAHKVSVLAGVPTMYHALWLADVGDRDLSRLRLASCGGSSMPEALLRGFEEKFGVVILEGYGLSETGSTATMNHSVQERRIGSIGKPIWGVEARLVDPATGAECATGAIGEIWLRGHIVMKGYFGNPEASAEAIQDGWLRTGDLARRDADGFLYVVDRIKDLIIRGGYNVYPREVEEVLYGHPDVAEAAVIGRPDERLGEEVVAVVSARPGHTIDPEALIAHCREHLALYKCPREVRVMDALPKSDTGKLLKRELRK
jgi:long-chain acyl-CoA synthetase